MKPRWCFFKSVPIILCLMLSGFHAFGQVAIPSMDRTHTSSMPAAASWRFSSTVGAAVNPLGTGEINSGTGVKTDDLERTALEGYIAHQFDDITFEYNNLVEFKEVMEDVSTNDSDTKTINQQRLNTAIRLGETISLGATYSIWENTSDYANNIGLDYESGDGKETGLGLGGSIRLADVIYLAAGAEQITHKQDGYEDNKWIDRYLAVGFMGEDDFRIEYSRRTSPETTEENAVSHAERQDSRLGFDIRIGDWVFSAEKWDYIVKPIGTGDDTKYEYTTLGLSLVPEKGLVLSVFGTTGKVEDIYSTMDFRFAVAFNY